ncbi:MAG: hypothetical protein KDA89_18100 [Planctomycetaceae bacterium]|nr:hypothetical protein [Planctomycetaceae bacterium]
MKLQPLTVSPEFNRKLLVATGIGAVVLLITALVSPDRAWANLLVTAYYLITLGLGGALFIALTNVTGAGWSTAFRRVPEAMTGLLPVGGVLTLAAVLAGLSRYGWHHHGEGDAGTFWFKEMWLQPGFLAVRAFVYVIAWIGFSRILVSKSRQQDQQNPSGSEINVKTSILFLFVFAFTISMAGVDWIMALEPLWFSTMWGVYQFSGLIMATVATIVIACIVLRKLGPLDGYFRDDHLHDLGKLLIGFSCFWMYIWFSQYMLIWYSNIPEETSYFVLRTQGAWGPVVIGTLVLNWIIPFFVLLPKPCKRSEGVMLKVAVVALIGRWFDLYVMVFPPVTGNVPVFGLPEVASMLCVASVSGLLFVKAFAVAKPVPQNDPFLQESLHYHC